MPSTRAQPLNPRLAKPLRAPVAPPAAQAEPDAAAEAARAGGFHESSYELRSGLEVNESEWPADTTIPGALGER